MITKIFLIRHAQTLLTKERKYCGRLNPALAEDGRLLARSLSGYFAKQAIDCVYSSPAKRATETAEIIFKHNNTIKIKDELNEIDFGEWEGLEYKQVMTKYARLYSDWINDPYSINIPGGESLMMIKKRTLSFLDYILSKHRGKNIVAVTHFGPIRLILSHVLNDKKGDFWSRKINPCSVNILEYDEKNNFTFPHC